MRHYVVPVRFSGRIEYRIPAGDGGPDEAMAAAERLANEEDDFSAMEDIDFEVKSPIAVDSGEPAAGTKSRVYVAIVKSSAVRDVQMDRFDGSDHMDDAAWADVPGAELYAGTYRGTEADVLAKAAEYMGTNPANVLLRPVDGT